MEIVFSLLIIIPIVLYIYVYLIFHRRTYMKYCKSISENDIIYNVTTGSFYRVTFRMDDAVVMKEVIYDESGNRNFLDRKDRNEFTMNIKDMYKKLFIIYDDRF